MPRPAKSLKRKIGQLEELEVNLQTNQEEDAAIQNSLDSDEEDKDVEEENYNVMDEEHFEGVEDGPAAPETNVEFTAFNLKEELEEGSFDKEGHYVWKKEKQIRDHWLDNIDWVKVQPGSAGDKNSKSESDSDEESAKTVFDPVPIYKEILVHLKPGETVSRALWRLGGGNKQLTTAERWKRRKDPIKAQEDKEKSEQITKLTELANELLTQTGNMDIYQENYDLIKKKVDASTKQSHLAKQDAELDMYSDDFSTKEQTKLGDPASTSAEDTKMEVVEKAEEKKEETVTWELKWSQEEKAEVHGPHTTVQMQAWSKEGYFKKGAWVRRKGQDQFYSASRIDFELYL